MNNVVSVSGGKDSTAILHIGQALGLSRHGAFQRYGDLENEK
jgi:7-cyano-7-deazaguanine synthase in queuosine biosynthesis